ncbi:MAG: glycosyltransferase family 39 protein [Acidobacteriota bacterium]|nr:glycosyltransferase family 39 protein [Acidobacteriota bacterium]
MTAADPHRFPRRAVLALLALAATLGLLELGRRDLWAPDEPKYALVAREMLETGQFLRPHVNGAPYPDKPPLLFWCIALASLVTGGVGQPAAVLPSILAMLLTLWATGRLAHRLSGQRAPPVLAVGLLLVAYRFISQGTFGQIDMLLTACTTWAFLLLVEGGGLLEGRPVDRRRIVGAFALMGLGILAKGPVALICPLGGFLLGAALAGRRDTWRSLRSAAAWLTLLAVVGAWLIPAAVGALSGGQQAWLENILFRQTAVRYAASWHHHQPPWYFLVVPWYDFLPTILLLPAAAWSLLRGEDRHRTAPRLLAGACLFVLIFFSIPSGKRGLYLMPLYPWLATWLAIDLDRRLQRAGRALAPLRGAGMLLGVAFLAAAAWLPRRPREGTPAPGGRSSRRAPLHRAAAADPGPPVARPATRPPRPGGHLRHLAAAARADLHRHPPCFRSTQVGPPLHRRHSPAHGGGGHRRDGRFPGPVRLLRGAAADGPTAGRRGHGPHRPAPGKRRALLGDRPPPPGRRAPVPHPPRPAADADRRKRRG